MQILKELSRKEFKNQFGTIEQCMSFLAKNKWSNGYECRKCQFLISIPGKQLFSQRCKKCGFDESPTSHTLFHKLKFGIEKAFEMVYEVGTSKKGANSIWLAERFGINQKTSWLFRQKIQMAMPSSLEHPLEKQVHIDEFEIGTPQKGEQGRSKSEKKIKVIIAVEFRDGKAGRGYARIIEDYSAKSFAPIFEEHISKDALVCADGWSSYKPFKEEYKNLTQVLSEKGKNFPMIHYQIRNFKNWLRGVHSYCNREYLQKYINEYFFRFNRRNHRKSILVKLLERMTFHKPMTFNEIKSFAI